MNPRIVARKLRVLYDALDPAAEARVRTFLEKNPGEQVSCSGKGCVGCCYQVVGVTIPEGLLMARAALERPDWLDLARRLRAGCEPLCERGITRRAYFERAIPCPFLEGGACSIYAQRPAACRFHLVISPAERCYPESGDTGTRAINMLELEQHVWNLNEAEMGAAATSAAPIQVTVLWCMRLLAGAEQAPELDELVRGIPNPHEWTTRSVRGELLSDIGDDLDSDARRELERLRRRA